ncbi:MAG: oxidoreductase [Paracoccus denitrificans]|nr:MAG: oxidoreductase [Paracoccus denitrificans]PZO82850.1 MAG: oxidoreductase [Paracoccus denitrificans]
MSKLFTSFQTGTLRMPNRIVIAPMCQYSAENGKMTDWHVIHLGQLAQSGAGLLTVEATAVTPEGRITYGDVGLWDDETEAAMARVLKSVRAWSDIPVAIQLAHAGRKASCEKPWDGGGQIAPDHPNGWQTEAPSPLPFASGDNPPTELTKADLDHIRDAFVDAATRSIRLGFDAIQLHFAHGYLLHEFLSPLSNKRTDEYGGSLEHRMRFPLEVFDAVKASLPADYPLSVRVSGTDWVPGGWDIKQTVELAKELDRRGCAAFHVSSGGLNPAQQIPVGPGYQVPLARAVKDAVEMPVVAVGLITSFDHAESIVATGEADLVGLARGILYDPHWPWHAAAHLGAKIKVSPQYLRSEPHNVKNLLVME